MFNIGEHTNLYFVVVYLHTVEDLTSLCGKMNACFISCSVGIQTPVELTGMNSKKCEGKKTSIEVMNLFHLLSSLYNLLGILLDSYIIIAYTYY